MIGDTAHRSTINAVNGNPVDGCPGTGTNGSLHDEIGESKDVCNSEGLSVCSKSTSILESGKMQTEDETASNDAESGEEDVTSSESFSSHCGARGVPIFLEFLSAESDSSVDDEDDDETKSLSAGKDSTEFNASSSSERDREAEQSNRDNEAGQCRLANLERKKEFSVGAMPNAKQAICPATKRVLSSNALTQSSDIESPKRLKHMEKSLSFAELSGSWGFREASGLLSSDEDEFDRQLGLDLYTEEDCGEPEPAALHQVQRIDSSLAAAAAACECSSTSSEDSGMARLAEPFPTTHLSSGDLEQAEVKEAPKQQNDPNAKCVLSPLFGNIRMD